MVISANFWTKSDYGPTGPKGQAVLPDKSINRLNGQKFMKNAKMKKLLYRHQRNKLRLDDVPKLPEWQRLRHQHSSTDMTVPNLVIRRASLVPAPHDLTGRKIPTATSVQTTNSEGTVFENHPKCLVRIFQFWRCSPIFKIDLSGNTV